MTLHSKAAPLALGLLLVGGCASASTELTPEQTKAKTAPISMTKGGKQQASNVETGEVLAAPPGVKTGTSK